MNTTSASLLERLRDSDNEAAWNRFVELYTPLLCYWARRLEVEEADVGDLVQDVFTILVQKLPQFSYKPTQRFRGWLWTVFVNKCREKHRNRKNKAREKEMVSDIAVPDHVEEISEKEYQQYLIRKIAELLRDQFQPNTWNAFWQCVIQDRQAAEVAVELGITENAVYISKCRVLRQLRQELDGLLD